MIRIFNRVLDNSQSQQLTTTMKRVTKYMYVQDAQKVPRLIIKPQLCISTSLCAAIND